MTPNTFTTPSSLQELKSLVRPGCSVILIAGETPENANAEIVTIQSYNDTEGTVNLTHPSMLFRSNTIPFTQARFAASSWIDLTNVDFGGLIGDSFKSLSKLLEEPESPSGDDEAGEV